MNQPPDTVGRLHARVLRHLGRARQTMVDLMQFSGDWTAKGRPTSWNGTWRQQFAEGSIHLEGVEVHQDGHAVAMVQADGRTLPLRFTFDGDRIARVEVL